MAPGGRHHQIQNTMAVGSGNLTSLLCSQDRALAAHVLSVHKEGRAPQRVGTPDALPPDVLRAYIAAAKQKEPVVPSDLTGALSALI